MYNIFEDVIFLASCATDQTWFVGVKEVMVRIVVFNATFNNISVISWQSVLLVEETGVPRENHQPAANHWQTLSHNVVSSIQKPRHNRDSNSGDKGKIHFNGLCTCCVINLVYINNSWYSFHYWFRLLIMWRVNICTL
jgi:hypothetical protein